MLLWQYTTLAVLCAQIEGAPNVNQELCGCLQQHATVRCMLCISVARVWVLNVTSRLDAEGMLQVCDRLVESTKWHSFKTCHDLLVRTTGLCISN